MKRTIYILICLILLPLAGCILVNPKTLDFGSNETTRAFKLTVIGDVEWSITPSESWIIVDPDSGQGTDSVNVTVDRTGLDDGSYEAILNISTDPNISCPNVIVKMTVGDVTTSTTTTASQTTSTIDGATTTTTSGGTPDPYFPNPNEGWSDFNYDKLGNCLGGEAFIEIGNRGDAGEVFLGIKWDHSYSKSQRPDSIFLSSSGSACEVIFMEKGEVREEGVWSEEFCPRPEIVDQTLTVEYETAPAKEGDKEMCNKAPDVRINSPDDGSTFSAGESIAFTGEAYDYEDSNRTSEPMPENSLVWTSDIDERIGTGSSFVKSDLSAGYHVITLTATDSLGKEGTDSISIFVDYTIRKVWEFDTGDEVHSSPAVSDGHVYVGSDNAKVYCLDANTGNKVWEFETYGEVCSSPAVSDGYVYVGGGSKVYCLDANTGNKAWEFAASVEVFSSPAVSGGYVYFGDLAWIRAQVFCLDAQTGDKVWGFELEDGKVYSSPAVSGGYVYFGSVQSPSGENKVFCLNSQTGEKVWEFEAGDDIYSSPAVSVGKVYIGGACFNANTGKKIWPSAADVIIGDESHISPAVSGEYVYRGPTCLNAQTGETVWHFSEGYGSSTAVSNGYVYMRDRNKIYCLNAQTGDRVWEFKSVYFENSPGRLSIPLYSSPAVSDGYLYVGGGDDGKIYCLKATAGDTGSWPMFKYNPARTGAK